MSQLLPVWVQIAAAIVGLGLSSCAPQSPQDVSPQAKTAPRGDASGATATAEPEPSPEVHIGSSTPNAGKEKTGINLPSKTQGRTSPEIYVAILKKAIVIPLLAQSGTVSVKNACLVATIDDVDYTAILPPQAQLVGPADAPTAIKLSRRSVPLGRQMSLPAGGAEFSSADLQSAIPTNCPKTSIVFAG